MNADDLNLLTGDEHMKKSGIEEYAAKLHDRYPMMCALIFRAIRDLPVFPITWSVKTEHVGSGDVARKIVIEIETTMTDADLEKHNC